VCRVRLSDDLPRPRVTGCRGGARVTCWHGRGARGRCGAGVLYIYMSENSNFVVFLAKIDVCRVRPCVIGRAPLTQGVVGMLGEQFGTAGGRGGVVGVCVLGVFQHISCF
jgi:hypothetical protein